MSPVIWLASYPRSGNTLTRVILAQCFGLPTAAVYADRLGGNTQLHALTGRIAPTSEGVIDFCSAPVRVVKTHSPPQDSGKAIYIVRNGINAVASFHDHGNRETPISTLINGRPGLPTWSGHIDWWHPRSRPYTLLLRYEDIVADIFATVDIIADFIGVPPRSHAIPTRDDMAAVDGKWIRSATAPNRTELTAAEVEHFWHVNGTAMREYGYTRDEFEENLRSA